MITISRVGFKPTVGHRVRSKHFEGGKKTYLDNVPTITPKMANKTQPQPRATIRASNREVLLPDHQNSEALSL